MKLLYLFVVLMGRCVAQEGHVENGFELEIGTSKLTEQGREQMAQTLAGYKKGVVPAGDEFAVQKKEAIVQKSKRQQDLELLYKKDPKNIPAGEKAELIAQLRKTNSDFAEQYRQAVQQAGGFEEGRGFRVQVDVLLKEALGVSETKEPASAVKQKFVTERVDWDARVGELNLTNEVFRQEYSKLKKEKKDTPQAVTNLLKKYEQIEFEKLQSDIVDFSGLDVPKMEDIQERQKIARSLRDRLDKFNQRDIVGTHNMSGFIDTALMSWSLSPDSDVRTLNAFAKDVIAGDKSAEGTERANAYGQIGLMALIRTNAHQTLVKAFESVKGLWEKIVAAADRALVNLRVQLRFNEHDRQQLLEDIKDKTGRVKKSLEDKLSSLIDKMKQSFGQVATLLRIKETIVSELTVKEAARVQSVVKLSVAEREDISARIQAVLSAEDDKRDVAQKALASSLKEMGHRDAYIKERLELLDKKDTSQEEKNRALDELNVLDDPYFY